jgi:hypothetical protein
VSEEKTYLKDSQVTVTSSRIVIGGKTYATRHITSVEIGSVRPNPAGPIILGIIGLSRLLCGIAGAVGSTLAAQVVVAGPGVVLLAAAIFLALRQKRSYTVMMTSAAGEVEALKTKDKGRVMQVVAAIQRAINEG